MNLETANKKCRDYEKAGCVGDLDLSGLTSAVGLTLPSSIGGGLYLSGLTSAAGLRLPRNLGGWLCVDPDSAC